MSLLSEAFELLPTFDIGYLKYLARSENEVGIYVSTYAPLETVEASVQAINRSKYHELGLDLQKNYMTVFVDVDASDIQRGGSGDVFVWNGRRLLCESENDWFLMDGWTQIQVVDIGAYTP